MNLLSLRQEDKQRTCYNRILVQRGFEIRSSECEGYTPSPEKIAQGDGEKINMLLKLIKTTYNTRNANKARSYTYVYRTAFGNFSSTLMQRIGR